MKYCAITLDLVNSRKISDRKEVQNELKEFLKKINQKYESVLAAPFAFTLGDEVQGVINNLHDSYPLIRDFQQFFQGQLFYAGVGFDKISTSLSKQSGEMDGPAFHLARASVETLKNKHLRVHSERFTPLIHYSFLDSEISGIVNNYLRIIEMLKYALTDKQSEVYWLLFETKTYREIAEKLEQSKSAITQKIQAGNIDEIVKGEEGFIELLNWIEKKSC